MNSSNHRDIGPAATSQGGLRHWCRAHAFSLLATAVLVSGCGGGGGSGGGTVAATTPSRVVNVSNAESATKLSLEMMDVTDALVASWGLGSGIDETRCESGSGIGTVSNCVIGANTFNGAVTATITNSVTITPPGLSQDRTMPTTLALAVSNLQWQSGNNRTTYNVNGNLLITYTYPPFANGMGNATATGTLTLTDTTSNIRYQYRGLTQRYTLRANSGDAGYYLFEHGDHEGTVVYMDENKQYLLTAGNILEYMALQGVDSKLSLGLSGDLYSINLDTDNDGNYDTFTTMPLTELGRGHGSSSNALVASVSRQGGNSSPVRQRVAVTLTSSASDADYNFHTFSWDILSAPPAATGDNAAVLKTVNQRTNNVTFTGTVAGDYIVRVTATEVGTSSPASTTALITLHVVFAAPTFEVTGLDGAVGTVDTPVSFPMQQQNLEGTVTTTLIAAPAGMTIAGNASSGYQLNWTPRRQFFPGMVETVTVQVSNEDHDVTQSYEVTVNDTGARLPLVVPGLGVNSYPSGATITNLDADGSGELLLAGSGSAFFGLNLSGSTPGIAIANPYELDTDASNLMAVRPLRSNGTVNAYAVASAYGVFVVSSADYSVSASRGLQLNLTALTSKRRFAVADVNNDGTDEILVLTKTVNSTLADQLFVLNQDLTTLVTSGQRALGQEFLAGNVDADADLEIVCGNGVILNATTLATEVEAGVQSGDRNYVLANVDADSQQEVIEVGSTEIEVFDVDTATSTVIAFGLNAENLNLFGLNADNDAADELVIGTTNNLIHVYSINKGAQTATLDRTIGTAASSSTVTEVARGNVAADSADELVFVSRHSSGGPQISVAALDGSLLIDGAAQALATGEFSAARLLDPAVEDGFFAASFLSNGDTAKGVLAVDASGEPAPLMLDVASDIALFTAAADIDNNGEQDLLASTTVRGDSDMSVLALLTSVSNWLLPITTGTPAPITAIQIDGAGDLETAYIERTGTLIDEAVSLVIQQVGGAELDRFELQASGPLLQQPIAIASADLDGDSDPDIVLLNEASLQTFEYVAGSLVQTANIAISATANALAIGDANADGRDEIALTRTGVTNAIQIYDGSLVLVAESDITLPGAALTFHAAVGARPLWLAGSRNQVMALDAQSLGRVWLSPLLHGQINSISVQTAGGDDQLRIGTGNAIYRSQP